MSENCAIISYTTSPSFLLTGAWKQIQAVMKAQFPLRNIHWKSATRSAIRTIQELDVKLVPFETIREEHVSQIPMTLLEKPLLHIYVVTCEPTDLETYKHTVKKQVKEWHNVVTSRRHQEWLIVHLVKGETPAPSGAKIFLKVTVFDKLKTDFNADKRDRCIQVTWSSANDNPLAWGEFGNRVKEGLVTAFDAMINQREEEVRRSESQRQMPGWNFCNFFILKESLASSFEGMNLLEEALVQFDELESAFNKIWREKNFSWFGSLINLGPDDDTQPLLSVTKKPYRDLILANSISVFDLRMFILARQCELLAKLRRFSEIAAKSCGFLARFSQRLQIVSESLPLFWIESWIYFSAISVVRQLDTWFTASDLEGQQQNIFYANKGELYETARRQLDSIGVRMGHLPPKPPFSIVTSPSSETRKHKSDALISNKELLESIGDREHFYKIYIELTNRAISMSTKAARRKTALKLHASLAALDLYRGQFTTALATYSSLPAHYAPHTWTALESYMLSRALDTHTAMEKPKDNEWLHLLLSYIRSYIDQDGAELLIHEEDKVEYITDLVSALSEAAGNLESDIIHPDHSMINLDITPDTQLAETQDGVYLNVRIWSRLPCDLPVKEMGVVVTGRELERYVFSRTIDNLVPGENNLRLFCPAIYAGIYIIDTADLRMGHLIFQWNYKKVSSKAAISYRTRNIVVRVPIDNHALDVTVDQSTQIELGKLPSIITRVSTGRNAVSTLKLHLSCPGITWHYAQVHADDKDVEQEIDDDAILLRNLASDDVYPLVVPHSDASALHDLRVEIEAEYVTKDQPSIIRTLRLTRVLFTTLPISVNVQDFFRGSRLISKFTVSTTSHQHIRIAEARLELPPNGVDGVTVSSPSRNQRIITATPAQPAGFLFAIDSTSGSVQESLTLVIRYRLLRSEVQDLVEEVVKVVLNERDSKFNHVLLTRYLIEALGHDASWMELYGVTGELLVPDMSQDGNYGEDLFIVKQRLAQHRHPDAPDGHWREIRIPVDVPYMHIVATARLTLMASLGDVPSADSCTLYAGQPISAKLTIDTSFHWGPNINDSDREYTLRYNVEEPIRDWLISGPKRGDFVAKDNGTFITQITLLALRHGELALPKVGVTALPIAGEMTMGTMILPTTEVFQVHGAERVLVLPRAGRSTFVVGMGAT